MQYKKKYEMLLSLICIFVGIYELFLCSRQLKTGGFKENLNNYTLFCGANIPLQSALAKFLTMYLKAFQSVSPCSLTDEQGRIVVHLSQAMSEHIKENIWANKTFTFASFTLLTH